MKKYEFTRNETLKRAEKIIKRALKRMGEKVTYCLVLDDPENDTKKKVPYSFHADFTGYARDINKSYIEMQICYPDRMKGAQKLRSWNASMLITIIHECCHWQHFWAMSVAEREHCLEAYKEGNQWQEIEEIAAWQATIKWLKSLGYSRSKSIIQNLRKFELPKGLILPPPFDKSVK